MKKINLNFMLVILLTVLVNVSLIVFTILQINSTDALQESWDGKATIKVVNAIELAELERNFGYVGFIHHFKNYVIRRDPHYFQQAERRYVKSKSSLAQLKNTLNDTGADQHIAAILETLELYYQKLLYARDNQHLDIAQLDERVKVDDSRAQAALETLRLAVLPKLKTLKTQTAQETKQINQRNIILLTILLPSLLISSLFTLKFLRKEYRSSRQLNTILNLSPDGILYINEQGKIIRSNESASTILGYTSDELCKMTVEQLVPEQFKQAHLSERAKFMSKPQSLNMEQRHTNLLCKTKDRGEIEVAVSLANKLIGKQFHTVCVIKDITVHKQLTIEATTDHLTGLLNRRAFDSALEVELQQCEHRKQPLSLILIDLDNFKLINDEYGHEMGDKALVFLANFLKSHSRQYDHIVRWGGDEFILICPNLGPKDSLQFAQRLRKQFFNDESKWPEHQTLSIGIHTSLADENLSPKRLLTGADKALFLAKEQGKNCVKHYKDSLQSVYVHPRANND
ncbi:GGDEF domain-containing protein [Pseudoalteromonas sp. SS15]|uniref:GGDEF domain-containing protein n=1 Tax=Pseudoalteromonas sp. SS15 TaxID=3139393 RepID=UPI003BAA01F0